MTADFRIVDCEIEIVDCEIGIVDSEIGMVDLEIAGDGTPDTIVNRHSQSTIHNHKIGNRHSPIRNQ